MGQEMVHKITEESECGPDQLALNQDSQPDFECRNVGLYFDPLTR